MPLLVSSERVEVLETTFLKIRGTIIIRERRELLIFKFRCAVCSPDQGVQKRIQEKRDEWCRLFGVGYSWVGRV